MISVTGRRNSSIPETSFFIVTQYLVKFEVLRFYILWILVQYFILFKTVTKMFPNEETKLAQQLPVASYRLQPRCNLS